MNGMTPGTSYDIEVELDKPRTIKIDFNTLCNAEEVSGLSFLAMEEEVNCIRLRALVWAGLQYEAGEPRLTLEEVGPLVGEHLLEVYQAIIQAWAKAMPDESELEGQDAENPPETATAPS